MDSGIAAAFLGCAIADVDACECCAKIGTHAALCGNMRSIGHAGPAISRGYRLHGVVWLEGVLSGRWYFASFAAPARRLFALFWISGVLNGRIPGGMGNRRGDRGCRFRRIMNFPLAYRSCLFSIALILGLYVTTKATVLEKGLHRDGSHDALWQLL